MIGAGATSGRSRLAWAVSAWLGVFSACTLDPAPAQDPAPQVSAEALSPPDISPRRVSSPDRDPRGASIRLLQEGRFDLDVQGADLRNVLVGLVRSSPFSLVVSDEVEGELTADLRGVSLFDIFEQIVVPRGYTYQVHDAVIRVERPRMESRTYHIDYPSYQRDGNSELTVFGAIESSPDLGEGGGESSDASASSLTTRQAQDFWAELEQSLRAIVGPSEEDAGPGVAPGVLVAEQSGLVVVRATHPVLAAVENFLAEMARTNAQQVLIDTRILEVALTDDLDLGVDLEYAPDLGGNTQGVIPRLIDPSGRRALASTTLSPVLTNGGFTFALAGDRFSARLRALAAQTDVRVVSTPRVATLNNHKALIKVVRNQVFFIAETDVQLIEGVGTSIATDFVPQIIPIGVTLDVTPRISRGDEITIHIHPSVSEVVGVQNQPSTNPGAQQTGSLPVIDLRETDTVVRVGNGETIVIGGLIRSRELDMESKVPLLGDLPVLGALFRSVNAEELRTELIILLTPTILRGPQVRRVAEDGTEAVRQLDELRERRRPRSHWWREPRNASYGVSP